MRNITLTAAFMAAAGLTAALGAGPAQADDTTPLQTLQAGAQGALSDQPGAIGAIWDHGTEQTVRAGFNDQFMRVPADPTSQVRIGSNTKLFISTVLLQLEAEHKLSLDDTVDHWLPGWVNANGHDGTKITIRQLLNMTSGIPDYLDILDIQIWYYSDTDIHRIWSPRDLVNRATAVSGGTVGTYDYSNTNYVLAAEIIQAVTGRASGTEIQDRILTPLGMKDTTYPTTDPTLHGNWMHGYFLIRDTSFSSVSLTAGAGNMVSTLHDQAVFHAALLGGKLVPAQQMAELKTTVPIPDAPGNSFGLGIIKAEACGQTAWGYNGAVIGNYTSWIGNDDGTRQVLTANNEYHGIPTKGQGTFATAAVNALCRTTGVSPAIKLQATG
ncbi:serine hydrolase domain-containing protein [Luteipulveratus mongoliensis]|uniref:Beta-lactamase-related domain-containing protein n=1 Tax=Luteipulveratus mongoliensis TaxID=571913 RepID=A0A0K1JQZ7_9MICO|nr:serine hydrolase [Luteipulveratus mongoliensis]AKU19146.1 hypothetical protein VV02_20285 [Luteipulveratus mongoliensis]